MRQDKKDGIKVKDRQLIWCLLKKEWQASVVRGQWPSTLRDRAWKEVISAQTGIVG